MNHNKDSFIANMTNAYIKAMVYFDFEEEYPNAQVSQEAFDKAYNDCEVFINGCETMQIDFAVYETSQLGQDLYLTLLKHGAGFGDGDYPEPFDAPNGNEDATIGDALTDICSFMGCREYYVGDDGLIYPA